jgi:hypothetical protein
LLRFSYFLDKFINFIYHLIVHRQGSETGHLALVSVDLVPYKQALLFSHEIEDEFKFNK